MKYFPKTRNCIKSILTYCPDLSNAELSSAVCETQLRPYVKLSGTMIKAVRKELGIKTNTPTVLMFVYGSLLKGLGNHRLLQRIDADFIAEDSISAKLYTQHWGWPFIKLNNNGSTVKGEVYSVLKSRVKEVDGLEGYRESNPENSLFIRHKIITNNNREVFIYEGGNHLLPSNSTSVEHGDWKKALNERNKSY